MLIDEAGRRLGLSSARLYVPDLQQVHLIALPYPARQDTPVLEIDDSVVSLAYRTQRIQRTPDGCTAWLPLIDGIERLGVMVITAPALDPHLLESCTALAGLTALLVASKATYSDLLVARERSRAMTIQAELLWSYLPPRAIGTDQVTSSTALEPAYDIGGDAFDHNLTENVLHLALLDAMGHDLASGGSSAAALAACRATRRDGGTLTDIATTIDRTLDLWIPGRLLTAVIANLDIRSGWLTWINCGHPRPCSSGTTPSSPTPWNALRNPHSPWDFTATPRPPSTAFASSPATASCSTPTASPKRAHPTAISSVKSVSPTPSSVRWQQATTPQKPCAASSTTSCTTNRGSAATTPPSC